MSASSGPSAAGPYDRPPYRVRTDPARTDGPGEWAFDVLLPWRLARRIYGPFRVLKFSTADLVGLGVPGGAVASTVAEQAVDPLIERLLLPRALLGLGVLMVVAGLFTGEGLRGPFEQGFSDALLMLATGPVALLLACAPLVVLARHGARLTVLRLCLRPLLTALLTTAFCALFVYYAVHHNDYAGFETLPQLLLGLLLVPWLTAFFGSALFLIHRNAFGVGGHPLVRPLASVPLAWLTAFAHFLFIDYVEAYPGSHPLPSYWVALFAGPAGVTVTAVVEVVLLRRRHGVGFRGPLPGWRPPPPPPPRLTAVPRALAARVRADLARGAAPYWPHWTDRNGVVWVATPVLHRREQVMWPYVPAFTDVARPALRSDVERVAGPLQPR
ncbi:hypothetical protein [Streptomyces sp. YKOK-I1]